MGVEKGQKQAADVRSPMHLHCISSRADQLSRTPDQHHYSLRQDVFDRLCGRYSFQCQAYLFANVQNTKCKKFFSERWSRHSQGTNAFANEWRERTWLTPPWQQAHQALRKLNGERCTALTLLPYWPGAPWWPLLLELKISPMTHLTRQLYTGPKGDPLQPLRWRTVRLVTQGRGMPAAPCENYSYSPPSPPSNAGA